MAWPHLFEFTDQPWLPASSRETFFEVLDLCNSRFRDFNASVAAQCIEIAEANGIRTIVEMGAGRAPITRHLAGDERTAGWKLVPCDLKPDEGVYRKLEAAFPDRVSPIYTPIDFSEPHEWEPETLLVFCASLHHIPAPMRPSILKTLVEGRTRVAVFEPMKRTFVSVLSVMGAIVPALLLPILARGRGLLRRAFWCWLFPFVPAIFLWDAVVSCLRQWTDAQWKDQLGQLLDRSRPFSVKSGRHSQTVSW